MRGSLQATLFISSTKDRINPSNPTTEIGIVDFQNSFIYQGVGRTTPPTNTPSDEAPFVASMPSISTTGTDIAINFSMKLFALLTLQLVKSAFIIKVNGRALNSSDFNLAKDGQYALKLSLIGNDKFFQDETVTIEYNNTYLDATQKLADENGNSVTSFIQLVNNSSTQIPADTTPARLSSTSSSTDGQTSTLSFDEPLADTQPSNTAP